MTQRYLIVDGMLSGTGIRDAVNGGYLNPKELGLSSALQDRIARWLERYAHAHFNNFGDDVENRTLDEDGIELADQIRAELPRSSIRYFSSAHLRDLGR